MIIKKKDFALGILCGAMLFSEATAMAAGITAEPAWQNSYVDGKQVSMTAYNIGGNNYVRLWDIGQHVGFNIYWLDGVRIDTDAPYTGVAPVEEAEDLPTIEEIRQEMILGINEVHRENGVSELTVNQSLMDTAQKCSAMLKHPPKIKKSVWLSAWIQLQPHSVHRSRDASHCGESCHQLVNSPGHFQTMIGTDYDRLGVGVTIDNGRAFCYMMIGNPQFL